MKFSTLLEIDLAGIEGRGDISWHNIKAKLNYLLNTRNVIYVDKVNSAWQEFIASDVAERDKKFKNILVSLQQEEELRLYIAKNLSLYRSRHVTPENMAKFLQLQQNFNKFLGCENIHIYNILLYTEWLSGAILLVKQHALKKISDEEKQKSANAEADALLMQIKDYQHAVCANILIRLEVIAKHGFIDNLAMMAIGSVSHDDANSYNADSWGEDKFQKCYLFVIKQGSSKQVEQLKQLLFDFGTIYIGANNHIAAYPKIYAKNELLLVKPWFGCVRWGLSARYSLFEKGFLQIELNKKIKQAQVKLADLEHGSMLVMQDRLYGASNAIQKEKKRVHNIQKYLWRYLYAKEYELCERWQIYLSNVHVSIKEIQLQQLQALTSNYDCMLGLMLHTDALSAYANILRSLSGGSESLFRDINTNFAKAVFTAILQVLFHYDLKAKKSLQALSSLLGSDSAPALLVSNYNDTKLLFNSLSVIDNAKSLFEVIIKYLAEDMYAVLLQSFFTSPLANATVVMQAYLNRMCTYGHIMQSAELQELQSFCMGNTVLVNPYVKDFNIADKYYEQLETVLWRSYPSAVDFLSDVGSALASYKNIALSYRLRSKLEARLESELQSGSVCDALHLQTVLEYGKLATKKQYCLGILKAKLSSGFSFEAGLRACNYYEIIEYDKELAEPLAYEIRQILLEKLITDYGSISLVELRQLLAGITPHHSLLMNFTPQQQEMINSFIDMRFATSWSSVASYFIGLLRGGKLQKKYYLRLMRILATEVSYSKDTQEAFAHLKSLNEESCYYWGCFGVEDSNVREVVSHISFVISSIKYLDDRVPFLDFIFSNARFLEFYKLEELQRSWEQKKLLLAAQQQLAGLAAKLDASSDFDNLLAVVLCLEENNFVFNDAGYVTEIIAKIIDFIWGYFRVLIEQSIMNEDLSGLMQYKSQIITRLEQYKFLTIEQQYELKFLAWIATIDDCILNSNLAFWRLAHDMPGSDINCLTLYLYAINYYPKQYAEKIHAIFLPHKKYMNREGVVRMFCEGIDNYKDGVGPFALAGEHDEPPPQLKLQLELVAELKNIDTTNIAVIERENAKDSLNYLIEFAASREVEDEARVILGRLSPESSNSNSYSPSFFS